MKPTVRICVLVAATSLLLAACGSQGETQASSAIQEEAQQDTPSAATEFTTAPPFGLVDLGKNDGVGSSPNSTDTTISTGGLVLQRSTNTKPTCLKLFDAQSAEMIDVDLAWFSAFQQGGGDSTECAFRSAAVVGNLLIFTENANASQAASPVGQETSYEVFAIDPRSGQEIWRKPTSVGQFLVTASALALWEAPNSVKGYIAPQRLNPETGETLEGSTQAPQYEMSVGSSGGWAIDVVGIYTEPGGGVASAFDLRSGELLQSPSIECSYTATDGSRYVVTHDGAWGAEVRSFPSLEVVAVYNDGIARSGTLGPFINCDGVSDEYVLLVDRYVDRRSGQTLAFNRGDSVSLAGDFFVIDADNGLQAFDPETLIQTTQPSSRIDGVSSFFRNVAVFQSGPEGRHYVYSVQPPE